MKKKGFTLVELLAVIAILSLLVIIALPNIMAMFKEAKKNSFLTECKQIHKTAQNQWMTDSMFQTDEQEYSRCDTCSGKSLKLSGRGELDYYIKMNKSGKIVKFYATDGSYQYRYDGNDLAIEDITNAHEVATLDEDDRVQISAGIAYPVNATDASLFTYYYNESEGLVITGYSPSGPKDIVIPNTIEGHPVTALSDDAFYNMGLNSVVLPSTLKYINCYETSGVFARNNLKSISLPEGLITIGDSTFSDNQLTSVTIPSSVTEVGAASFYGNNLKSVTINGNANIGYHAFAGNQIEQINFGSSATGVYIGDAAFRENKITNLVLTSAVSGVGEQAFARNNMKTLRIENGVLYRANSFIFNEIETLYVDTTSIVPYAFSTSGGGSGGHLTSLTLGEHVNSIGKWAFSGNSLTTVTIPSGVTRLDDGALSSNQLRSIIIKGKNSSSEFSKWTNGDKGWADDVTCVKDNTSNVPNGCITWGA